MREKFFMDDNSNYSHHYYYQVLHWLKNHHLRIWVLLFNCFSLRFHLNWWIRESVFFTAFYLDEWASEIGLVVLFVFGRMTFMQWKASDWSHMDEIQKALLLRIGWQIRNMFSLLCQIIIIQIYSSACWDLGALFLWLESGQVKEMLKQWIKYFK